MTGIDCLKQEMMTRYGLSEKQAEQAVGSTNAKRIIETLADCDGLLDKAAVEVLQEREREIELKKRQVERDHHEFYRWRDLQEAKLRDSVRKHEADLERLKALDEKEAQLEELEKQITQFETKEARDRLRMFEIFRNTVDVQTPQNNTAFIAGVAAILSGASVLKPGPDTGDNAS